MVRKDGLGTAHLPSVSLTPLVRNFDDRESGGTPTKRQRLCHTSAACSGQMAEGLAAEGIARLRR